MAMADGEWDEKEHAAIASWIEKVSEGGLSGVDTDLKERLKETLKTSLELARNGEITLSDATEWLSRNADSPLKFEAVELCLEVMAADGVAEESELHLARKIADALDLDFDSLQTVLDSKLIELSSGSLDTASPEAIVGIEEDWDKEQILEHLRKEYSKWNARLNVLEDGAERENAQRMLNLIAEIRKSYDE